MLNESLKSKLTKVDFDSVALVTIVFSSFDLKLTFFEILSIILHLLIVVLTLLSGLSACVPVGVEAGEYDCEQHCEEHAAIENGTEDDTAMDAIIIFNRYQGEKHEYKVTEVADDTLDSHHLTTNIAFQTLSIKSIDHGSLKSCRCV